MRDSWTRSTKLSILPFFHTLFDHDKSKEYFYLNNATFIFYALPADTFYIFPRSLNLALSRFGWLRRRPTYSFFLQKTKEPEAVVANTKDRKAAVAEPRANPPSEMTVKQHEGQAATAGGPNEPLPEPAPGKGVINNVVSIKEAT